MSGEKYFVRDCEPCDSSNQSSMISTQLRDMEDVMEHCVAYEKCSVFHCAHPKCNLVLGDSLGACGEVNSLKCIVCLSKSMHKKDPTSQYACLVQGCVCQLI